MARNRKLSAQEEEEERLYRIQRRAMRDGLRDYSYRVLLEKLVTTVGGWILGFLLLYSYAAWDMSKAPAKQAKSQAKKAQKELLYKKMKQCHKTGNPKRKECSDIWWKWVRL